MSARSNAIIVIDLAFGDCGKGTIVDYLARERDAHTVVRFNGGPQAGHNVVLPDGRHHTFSQFGAGTFVDGVRTLLSRFMLIEPYAMLNEAAHLESIGVTDAWERLSIDRRCKVITPLHQAANRIRELARGPNAHGTCGMGVGECVASDLSHPDLTITANDLTGRDTLARKFYESAILIRAELTDAIATVRALDLPRARESLRVLDDLTWIDVAIEMYASITECAALIDEDDVAASLACPGTTIFEGAQGVLLDETHGFHPHTTWSTTTSANAHSVLDEARFTGDRQTVGVLRTYFTRHGAGPFVTEDPTLRLDERHNNDEGWQGAFRVGVFDAVAARYALSVAGPVDALALTHLDRLDELPGHICVAYRDRHGGETPALISGAMSAVVPVMEKVDCDAPRFVQRVVREVNGLPVAIESYGATFRDKRFA